MIGQDELSGNSIGRQGCGNEPQQAQGQTGGELRFHRSASQAPGKSCVKLDRRVPCSRTEGSHGMPAEFETESAENSVMSEGVLGSGKMWKTKPVGRESLARHGIRRESSRRATHGALFVVERY